MKKLSLIFFMLIYSTLTFADASTKADTISHMETGWQAEGVYIYTPTATDLMSCGKARYLLHTSQPMFV